MAPEAKSHLSHYVNERLPILKPGFFEGAADLPSFTVDQQYRPLKDPAYAT